MSQKEINLAEIDILLSRVEDIIASVFVEKAIHNILTPSILKTLLPLSPNIRPLVDTSKPLRQTLNFHETLVACHSVMVMVLDMTVNVFSTITSRKYPISKSEYFLEILCGKTC